MDLRFSGTWKAMLRALSHRNYRLFVMGQSVSLIGTWMEALAISWLVYRLTNSAFYLGILGFAGQIPNFFLSPLAGVLSDRWNRHHVLIATQTLALLEAATLATLALTGTIAVWQLIVLRALLGCVNAFDITNRQAFLLEMVPSKEDLANAIALNSSMMNGARLFGPSLAGLVIALVGEGICFLLNAISYLAVIAALLAMRVPSRPAVMAHPSLLQGLRQGFTYVWGFAAIRSLLLLLALVSLLGMSYTVLMPVFARQILHGGPSTLGWLMAASGIGALVGAVYFSSRATVVGLGSVISLMPFVFGSGLIAFALSQELWLSLLVLPVVGFGTMVLMASCNTILQTISDEDKRGRVMSYYTMAFMGVAPFGSLLAGSLADLIGARATVILSAVCCMGSGLVFARNLPALRTEVRPIYERLGIITKLATGVQGATELSVPPER